MHTHACSLNEHTFPYSRDFSAGNDPSNGEGGLDAQMQHQQYLGEGRPELDQFPYPEWEGQNLPSMTIISLHFIIIIHTFVDGITNDDLSEFIALYREHCEVII